MNICFGGPGRIPEWEEMILRNDAVAEAKENAAMRESLCWLQSNPNPNTE